MVEIIGGRFEIGEALGQGGMGMVFHGLDQQTGQPVAIKQLKPELVTDNRDLVERFAREGEALRRLNHPNIVKMLVLLNENERYYLVMEYVSGGSLADYLKAHSDTLLPIEQILHIALELADALTRAHHLKIIHRDIKPANVLLAEDGTPRLTDFGIARLDDQSRMTESGLVVGTFAYLSPEACEGRDLDARTDIWSFGVMLYEMLTGRKPFEAETTAAIITAILMRPTPDLLALRPDTPPALANLIDRMLQKDRNKRISSIRQVGAELEAILRGDTGALPDSFVGTPYTATPLPVESRFATPTPADDSPTTILPPAVPPRRPNHLVWIGALLLFLLVGALGIASGLFKLGGTSPTATPAAEAVEPGTYQVLVAPFTAVRTDTRDVAGLITQDLKQHFEVEVSYSKIQISEYPTTITSDDEALAAAEATGATVVIWGNYTADTINANVQIGSLAAFKYNKFDRDLLERTANLRATMTDETKESLAPQVLAVLGVLVNADGDLYGVSRNLITLEALKSLNAASVSGNTVAERTDRYFMDFADNPDQSIEEMNQAIDLDAGNALLYAFRSQALYHLGAIQCKCFYQDVSNDVNKRRSADVASAQKLGPKNWTLGLALSIADIDPFKGGAGQTDLSTPIYDQLVELRPDDWYVYYLQYVQYQDFIGNPSEAQKALDRSLVLHPDVKYPQAIEAVLALQQGRIADAAALVDGILADIPADTFFTTRLATAAWDRPRPDSGLLYAPFSKLILGQYQEELNIYGQQVASGVSTGVDTFLVGMGQCGLGNLDKAQTSFKFVASGDYLVANLFLAEYDLKQGNQKQALAHLSFIQQSNQADLLAPFAAAVLNHDFDCTDLFNSQKIAEVMQKYGNIKSADLAATLTAVPTATLSVTPTPEATAAPAVEPVGQGEYMVLVAPFTAVRTDTHDAAGLIAQDLKQHFESEAPYSKLRIRQYPTAISSDDEAKATAEATGATVVIWGNYTVDTINANVQIGSLAAFRYNKFDRALLERTANLRATMTDETKESLAPQVLAIMGVLFNADGDAYRRDGIWAALDTLKGLTPAATVGQSVAAYTYGYFANYLENPDQSVEELNQAVNLDVSNALLYSFRIQALNRATIVKANGRAGVLTEDQQKRMAADTASAQQFAPPGWPLAVALNPITSSQADIAREIELRPDDWYYYYAFSTSYVNDGNWQVARENLDKAIALNPDIKLPQAMAVRVALHQGRLADAAALTDTVRTDIIADTFYVQGLRLSGFGVQNDPSVFYAPFSKLIVGQYQDARDLIVQLAASGRVTDPILLGLVQCGLGDDDKALLAFKAVSSNTDYIIVNLLEADLYLRQNNRDAALEQISIVQRSDQADLLAPFAAAVLNGDFGCADLFNSQKIAAVMQKYGNVKGADIAATLTAFPTVTPAASATP